MPTTFTLKQHDLEPKVVTTLTNADGTAIDLTTATAVHFIIKPVNNSVLGAFRSACTITSAPTGVIRYAWTTGDTDVVGIYNAEFEITWPTARPQTVPNTGYNTLTIEADLG